MSFIQFTSPASYEFSNAAFISKSYVSGFAPSQADVEVFKALPSAPDAAQYPALARWYKHIESYSAEHETLPIASTSKAPAAAAPAAAPAAEDDDELDLFGSDDEEVDAAAEELKNKRIAEYNAKKANKPKTIAKSVVTLDVKPWDDETDMAELEKSVRSITKEGLVWGLSKLVPVGYGVRKLQMTVVIEDDLVSLDELQEEIAEFEDFVQSSDVVAMQKL